MASELKASRTRDVLHDLFRRCFTGSSTDRLRSLGATRAMITTKVNMAAPKQDIEALFRVLVNGLDERASTTRIRTESGALS